MYPPQPEGGSGAAGSGCAPGPGDLPDGIWFGNVVSIDANTVTFDLACFTTGPSLDPDIDGPVISNDNETLRVVPVAATASVHELWPGTDTPLIEIPFTDWPSAPDTYGCSLGGDYSWCGVWLAVNNGAATQIVEQYLP